MIPHPAGQQSPCATELWRPVLYSLFTREATAVRSPHTTRRAAPASTTRQQQRPTTDKTKIKYFFLKSWCMKIRMGETPVSGSPTLLAPFPQVDWGRKVHCTRDPCQQSSAPNTEGTVLCWTGTRWRVETTTVPFTVHKCLGGLPLVLQNICLLLQTDWCWFLIKTWGGRHGPGRS